MMEIISADLTRCWASFGEAKSFEYTQVAGISVFKSCIDAPFFNCASIPDQANGDDINQVIEYFGETSFSLISDVSNISLHEKLAAKGLQHDDNCSGMTMSLKKCTDSVDDRLSVVFIHDQQGLHHWIDIVSQGFEIKNELVRDFALPLLDFKEQRFCIAYLGENPVSACLSCFGDRSAFLAFVATKPENRRMGAGRAVVAAALHDAYHEGYTRVSLQSSKMGEGLYGKMGFTRAGTYNIWRSKKSR